MPHVLVKELVFGQPTAEFTQPAFRGQLAEDQEVRRLQTRKMMEAAGEPDRFIPWVGLEHFGSNWLTPDELRRLLGEMQAQGATRYCYFVYNSMKPEIWDVIASYSRT